jgi:hypothetical protein
MDGTYRQSGNGTAASLNTSLRRAKHSRALGQLGLFPQLRELRQPQHKPVKCTISD